MPCVVRTWLPVCMQFFFAADALAVSTTLGGSSGFVAHAVIIVIKVAPKTARIMIALPRRKSG